MNSSRIVYLVSGDQTRIEDEQISVFDMTAAVPTWVWRFLYKTASTNFKTSSSKIALTTGFVYSVRCVAGASSYCTMLKLNISTGEDLGVGKKMFQYPGTNNPVDAR